MRFLRCMSAQAGVWAILAASLFLAAPAARAQTVVDLELVLAVDASGSVDGEEYALQIGGIAAAFRDPAVINAIRGGRYRRIAVAMVVWADAAHAKDPTGWWIIDSSRQAHAFADFIEARPRRVLGGATGIASGVAAAVAMIEGNDIVAERRVVDVSGDGVENSTQRVFGDFIRRVAPVREIAEMRAIARARGITINGLAILNDVPNLTEWYDDHVRFGPGSFVMSADDYYDFAVAIRAKLLREIGEGPSVSERGGPAPRGHHGEHAGDATARNSGSAS